MLRRTNAYGKPHIPWAFSVSISSLVTGRFKPEAGATPHIGEIAKLETVEEERIEVTCDCEVLQAVIVAIKSVHPYEEVAIDVYALESVSI